MDTNEKIKQISFLIDDELEAIKGYQKVIDSIEDEDIIKKLEEIKHDEQEHVRELSVLMFKL